MLIGERRRGGGSEGGIEERRRGDGSKMEVYSVKRILRAERALALKRWAQRRTALLSSSRRVA
eukprot:4585985-Heterocapsa_arctica.AAC.1